MPRNLLYPRTKGFVASVQKLRKAKQIKAVYDVTIAYARKSGDGFEFQEAPTFAQSIVLPHLDDEWKFFVHVERHPIDDLPRGDGDLSQWLEDRWIAKGEHLEKLRLMLLGGSQWELI